MAEVEFIQKSCPCGFIYMVPESFDSQRQDDHQSFFCPACGSKRYYAQDNEEEELRERLAHIEKSYRYVRASRDRTKARLEHEVRVRTGYQGQAAKLKRQMDAAESADG